MIQRQEKNLNQFNIGFHVIWFTVTLTLCYALYDFESFFKHQDKPIASLVDKKGSARVRYYELNLWRDVENKQDFYKK